MACSSLLRLFLGLLLACWQQRPARAKEAAGANPSLGALPPDPEEYVKERHPVQLEKQEFRLASLGASLTGLQTALAGHRSSACGVASIKKKRWEEPSSVKPQCGALMSMNCSISYMQLSCPDSCPFLAPHPYYPCRFRCVERRDCSDANRNLALPNNTFRACMRCPLEGCALCKNTTVCEECFKGFFLENGTCHFSFLAGNWATITMWVLVVLVVILILIGVIFYCTQPWNSHRTHNLRAIMAGRRHRHLSKVMRWDLKSDLFPRTWYTLGIDLQSENVLGSGLALFYNSICLVFVVALLVFGAQFYLLLDSNALDALVPGGSSSVSLDTTFEEALEHSSPVHALAPPSYLVSPLDQCAWRTPHNYSESLLDYAHKSAICYAILYVTLFMVSIIFARMQYQSAEQFDASHKTMKDFVMLLEGLPSSQTDEQALKMWLQQQLDQQQLKIELEGVSVQYDYSAKEQEVNSMLARHHLMLQHELHAHGDDDILLEAADVEGLKNEMNADREIVRGWFSGGKNSLKGTGKAFVVFKRSWDSHKIKKAFEKNPKLLVHPDWSEPLRIEEVHSEPPDIFWQNAHFTEEQISRNEWKNSGWVLFMFLLLNGLVTWPWYIFGVLPYSRSGSDISGPVTMLSGILMGILNGVLGGETCGAAFRTGYGRKDRADIFIFVVMTVMNLTNTMLNVYLFAFSALEKKSSQTRGEMLTNIAESEWLGEEADVVGNVLQMMIGGNLTVNKIMGLVTNALINPLLFTLMQKVVYVWKCWPKFLLKILHVALPWCPPDMERYEFYNAEKCLEAPQVGLSWDYGALISNCVVVFWCLNLVSPRLWELCLALVVFAAFFWVWCRELHLRVHSVGFISTHRLDHVMMLFWGLPLTSVGTASVTWCIRAGHFMVDADPYVKKSVLVVITFIGWAVWIALVQVVYPYHLQNVTEHEEGTLEDCNARWCFTWFNCNPIFALKCMYYIQDEDGKTRADWEHPLACGEDKDKPRFYRFGKEYLFLSKEKQKYVTVNLRNFTEPETILEMLFALLDKVFSPRSKQKVSSGSQRSVRQEAVVPHPDTERSDTERGLLLQS